jgi:hypothetical protein
MKRIAIGLLLAALAGTLGACGKKHGSTGAAAGGGGETYAPSGNASADEVAKESRGDVDCPADVKSPARAANAPVDDVLGVRPGLTYEEAANLVMCTHDLLVLQPIDRGVNMQTYGQKIRQGFSARFAEARVEKSSKQIMKEMQEDYIARSGNAVVHDMKPGQSKWGVSTMGVPGQERVIAAAREEWFNEGKNPTMESVAQALLTKYGTATRDMRNPGQYTMVWSHDPLGRAVTETSPLYNRCTGNSSPDGGNSFTPDCGVVVMATVVPTHENPALAEHMQVGVVNQAAGYEAITSTEQALGRDDAQKKAKQVEDASKNADKPQL